MNLPDYIVNAMREAFEPVPASLEDMAVTVPAGTAGAVTLALTAELSALLTTPTGLPAGAFAPYLLQYRVTTDGYAPKILRFGVRPALN